MTRHCARRVFIAPDPKLDSYLNEPFPNDLDDFVGTRTILASRRDEEIAVRIEWPDGLLWLDEVIDGPGATTLTLRIYRDDATPGPYSALLFFHGGAFVFGDLETEHNRCRRLAHGQNKDVACSRSSTSLRLTPTFWF
jgi:acetyl esterase/lipase